MLECQNNWRNNLDICYRNKNCLNGFRETFTDVYFELFLSISHPGPHGMVFFISFPRMSLRVSVITDITLNRCSGLLETYQSESSELCCHISLFLSLRVRIRLWWQIIDSWRDLTWLPLMEVVQLRNDITSYPEPVV